MSLDILLENFRSSVTMLAGAEAQVATAKTIFETALIETVGTMYLAVDGGIAVDTIKKECEGTKAFKSGASVHAGVFTGRLLALPATEPLTKENKIENIISLIRRVYNTSGGGDALRHVFATKRTGAEAYEAIKALDPKVTVESLLTASLKAVTKVSEAGVDWNAEGDVAFSKIKEVLAVMSERRTEFVLSQSESEQADADQQQTVLV